MMLHTGFRDRPRSALRQLNSYVNRRTDMLSKDFKEFLSLLNLNQVEYLVVGGYALAAHGHPRYTGDIDV